MSRGNDQSPIRFRRAFSFANPVRAKLNLAVAKSTNFIDLASVEDEPEKERARKQERERESARARPKGASKKEPRGLGLNANRAGALWAEGPELKGPGVRPRDIARMPACVTR